MIQKQEKPGKWIFPESLRRNQPGSSLLVVQLVKNPPVKQETPVQFLGGEDPLEKG